MDEGIGSLVVLVIAAIVAIILLPFIVACVVLFLSGRQLLRQGNRYEFTEVTFGVLALHVLASVVASFLILQVSGYCASFLLPLSVLIAFSTAPVLIAIWAFAKTWPYRFRVFLLGREAAKRNRTISRLEEHRIRIDRENKEIRSVYGALRIEKRKLERIVREVSLLDAQVLTLKARELAADYAALEDDELLAKKTGAISRLDSSNGNPALSLEAALLRLEEIRRLAGEPHARLEENENLLSRAVDRSERLQSEREILRGEAARARATRDAFVASRIVLN